MSRRGVVSLAVLVLGGALAAWLALTAPRRAVAELAARARAELEAENARLPEAFPLLDGGDAPGEILSRLAAAGPGCLDGPGRVFERHALEPLRAGRLHAFSPLLVPFRNESKASVARVRAALAASSIAPRLPEAKRFDSIGEEALAWPLEVASFEALDAGRAEEALELALDAWRLRFAVRRELLLEMDAWRPHGASALVLAAAASVSSATFAKLERRLEVLETLMPRASELPRRTRLATDRAFVALSAKALDLRAFRADWLATQADLLALEREAEAADPSRLVARVKALETARRARGARPVIDPFRLLPWLERWVAELSSLRDLRAKLALGRPRAPVRGPLERVDTSFEDTRAIDALETLARVTGHPVHADSTIGDDKVTLALAGTPWRDAVAAIASLTRATVRELPRGTLVLDPPPLVTLAYRNVAVRPVVALIAAYAGENVVLDPRVSGDVSIAVDELDWRVALAIVARQAHLDVVALPTRSRVTVLAPAPPSRPPFFCLRDRAGPTLPAVRDLEPSRPRVELEATQEPLADVLAELRETLGLDLVVEPDVNEDVTASLCEVPWTDALELIAHLTRCEIRREGPRLVFGKLPPVKYQAAGVPARVWLDVIARRTGLSFEVPRELDGWVALDLSEVVPEDVAVATAAALGCKAVRRGSRRWAFEPTGPRPPRREGPSLPVVTPVVCEPPRCPDDPALRREVEAILASVARAVASRDPAAIGRARQLLDGLAATGTGPRVLVASLLATHDDLAPGAAALVGDRIGDAHLAAAARARQLERFGEGLAELACVTSLATTLHGRGAEAIRVAEALEARAAQLESEARALIRIAATPIVVSAILLDPRTGGTHLAIVNGFPRGPGDPLLDTAGRVVPDAFVRAVNEGSVGFAYRRVHFIRELRTW